MQAGHEEDADSGTSQRSGGAFSRCERESETANIIVSNSPQSLVPGKPRRLPKEADRRTVSSPAGELTSQATPEPADRPLPIRL